MPIRDRVLDAFEAFSLLLVFASVLFGLKYREIIDCLGEDIPAGRNAVARLEKRTIVVLWTGCIPAAAIAGITAFLYLPLTCEILSTHTLAVWDFDAVISGFVLIEGLIGAFAMWTFVLVVQMVRKIGKVKQRASDNRPGHSQGVP